MEQFAEAGVTLIAISYDEPDALAAFAEQAGVTFPLLSDPDSRVIREFGILNTLMVEDDHPWFGVPFPGTYVTDEDGVIIAKFFENNLSVRPGFELLLRAAQGEDVSADLVAAEPAPSDHVEVSIGLDEGAGAVTPGTVRELQAQFRVPNGRHLYGEPVPEAMVATTIEVDDQEGLVILGVDAPPTTSHTLGSGETLQVYEGDVMLRVRFTQTGRTLQPGEKNELTVTGRVRYQSCDDETCDVPTTQPFELSVPINWGHRARFGDVGVGDIDFAPLLEAMTTRRQ